MNTLKELVAKINTTIDTYFPTVPNWCIWTIGALVIYLILK
jgi:hypothetical protein